MEIAILDKHKRLIGSKSKVKLGNKDVECGDLPTDGTYRLDDDGTFWPIGKGHGKPERPPVSDHKVLHLIAKTLGKNAPQEVLDWIEWYEQNMERI